MKPLKLKYQNGFALLIFVVILMGIGGIALTGYTQGIRKEVEDTRYLHNQRVLIEAKQAILQYAYDYPVNNPGRGPGRLPCPDTDNNGSPNPSFNCISGTPIVGRFPWNDPDMNFYDARDASGERLWYAVSKSFANQISPAASDSINTSSAGTITIHDQSGSVMYDGAASGVAAVIIAPGAEIDIQDHAADVNDPANYLDKFGALDNSDFINGDSANGFVVGPIFDGSGSVIINDQMILVTAKDVTAIAERATLEAYKNAIDNYQQTIWGATVANYRYPWMNGYADISDLNIYDVPTGKTKGRIPFINYYIDHDSHILITDLIIDYDIDLNLTDTADGNDPSYIDAFNAFFAGTQTLDISGSNLSFEKEKFDGSGNATDDFGTLVSAIDGSTVVNSSNSSTETLFFWDGNGSPLPENGWEFCPVSSGDEEDCARNPAGTAFEPFTDWSNHANVKIRRVILQWNLDAEFAIEIDYSIPGSTFTYTAPTGAANASFTTTGIPASITVFPVDVDSSLNDSADFIDVVVTSCEQDNTVGSEFNIFAYGNDNAGSAFCTPTLVSAVTVNQLEITADYYPELPLWVKLNNWNDSIMMAYANDYKPGGSIDCVANPPCLTLTHDFDGLTNNKVSLLLGAGSIPTNSADLENIFETENNVPAEDRPIPLIPATNDIFDANPEDGNDTILVLDET